MERLVLMILTIFFLNTHSHILIGVGNFLHKIHKNTLQLSFYVLQYKYIKGGDIE